MDLLDELENESIYIIREAYASIKKLGMLWSIGKDSTVLMWLVRKAFFGHVPIQAIHVDTSYKIPEMIAYRDRCAEEWGLDLVVGMNKAALADGMNHERGRLTCCGALKSQALKDLIEENKWGGLLVGIRRDEEGSRAKERIFSPRRADNSWDFKDQPPELWDQFRTDFGPDTHVRVHPLLNWTELNIWEYIDREKIPLIDLYFANEEGRRYRSLGCAPCTGSVESNARTVAEIVEELKTVTTSERGGRAQDKADSYAMQKLRVKGYM